MTYETPVNVYREVGAFAPVSVEPKFSPVNGPIINYELDDRALAGNVLFCGDDNTHIEDRMMSVADGLLRAGRQIISFSMSIKRRAFGLGENSTQRQTRNRVLRIGRDAHGFTVLPEDGASIAQYAIDTGESIAIELSGPQMNEVARAKFMNDFFSVYMESEAKHVTFFIERLDAFLPRTRHRDSLFANSFRTLITTGNERGLSVVASAHALSEITQEAANSFGVLALTQCGNKLLVRKVARVMGTYDISKHSESGDYGLQNIPQDHCFVVPLKAVENQLPKQFGPYYWPLRVVETKADRSHPSKPANTSPGETNLIQAIRSARNTAEEAKRTKKAA